MRHVGLLMLCLTISCGGGTSTKAADPADPEVGGGGGTTKKADKQTLCKSAMSSAEAAHKTAWDAVIAKGAPKTLEDMAGAACQLFCGRSTECAIEDACETLSTKKLAALKLEQTAPKNTQQCVTKCNTWRMTKRQIQTLGNCSQNEESSCKEFKTCADAAQQMNSAPASPGAK